VADFARPAASYLTQPIRNRVTDCEPASRPGCPARRTAHCCSPGTASEMAGCLQYNERSFKMSTDNQSRLPDEQNKKKAKSQDPRLQTKQEGDPNQNTKGGVAGSGTSGSSDGTGSA
jgi:hypothetical protein